MKRHGLGSCLAAGCLLLAFLVIYLPGIGHGFIQDDFRWIAEGRIASSSDVVRLFGSNVGFYRPLVSASFAMDYLVWHMDPYGYAVTNLVVFLVNAVLVFCLARRLFLPGRVALLTAAMWVFNFHGVNMSLLWISGRTALLLCVFALTAALAALSGKRRLAGVLSLLAMLCKEEAVVLPAFLALVAWMDRPSDSPRLSWRALRHSLRATWPAWTALAAYLGLRLRSGAFWPRSAPAYYQFSFDPSTLFRNVLEYLDREATVGCATLLIVWLFTRPSGVTLSADEGRALRFGAVWLVAFNAITVFLPFRSDLYTLAPSVGFAVVAAAVASALGRAAPRRGVACGAALVVAAFLTIPIRWQRNERWVAPAELSTRVLHTLTLATAGRASGRLLLVDDPSARINLDTSFGALFADAVHLVVGPAWTAEIVQPAAMGIGPRPDVAALTFTLRNGDLIPAVPTEQ